MLLVVWEWVSKSSGLVLVGWIWVLGWSPLIVVH
jgi:hypothetical protein